MAHEVKPASKQPGTQAGRMIFAHSSNSTLSCLYYLLTCLHTIAVPCGRQITYLRYENRQTDSQTDKRVNRPRPRTSIQPMSYLASLSESTRTMNSSNDVRTGIYQADLS